MSLFQQKTEGILHSLRISSVFTYFELSYLFCVFINQFIRFLPLKQADSRFPRRNPPHPRSFFIDRLSKNREITMDR